MKAVANRPKIWFKILTDKGEPIDGSGEQWSLPHGRHNGDRLDFSAQQAFYCNKDQCSWLPGVSGTWLVNDPRLVYRFNNTQRVFVAELLSTPAYEAPGTIWVHHVRLVRQATNLDLKRFGIYRSFRPII